jgi:cyclohexanecarboxylate-CoA ligase
MLERPPPRDAELARSYRDRGYWTGESLADALERTAARRGPEVAVVDAGVRLSFAELRRLVTAAARGLARLGVAPGAVVSIQLPNWWETVVLFGAVARLGAVIHPILPTHRRQELELTIAEAGSRLLVVPQAYRGFDHLALANELRAAPGIERIVVVRGAAGHGASAFAELLEATSVSLPPPPRGDSLLLLMYTSGTSAEPKGVLHSHDALLYEARSLERAHGLAPADTVLMPSPLAHVSGFVHATLVPFVLGTRAVLADVWDPDAALRSIERERVTYMVGAPLFLSDLCTHPHLDPGRIASLRLFSCGGADVSPDLVLDARRRLGCVVKRVYGSTELPTLTTSAQDDPPARAAFTDGRPIWAAEAKVVGEGGEEVPRGIEGDVLGRGPECFLGYRNPAHDADAFAPGAWFRTGDLGAVDERGYLTITGRRKDIVIRKGEKLSAAEVEEAIRKHPAVADVAVIAVPDRATGERACACVVTRDGTPLPLPVLIAFLRDSGMATRKLPERIESFERLPRTASGKIAKAALRELVLSRG